MTDKITVIRDDLWGCTDCLYVEANGYDDSLSTERNEEVATAIANVGGQLVSDYDSETGDGIREFSWRPCDICGSPLGGSRHRFAVLSR